MRIIKYFNVLLGSSIVLIIITLLTNKIVSPADYSDSLPKLVSEAAAWIGYFGNVFGNIIGGIIGGIIAYLIAKHQLDEQKKVLEEDNRERSRKEMQIKAAELILDSNYQVQETLFRNYLYLTKLLKGFMRYIDYSYDNDIEQSSKDALKIFLIDAFEEWENSINNLHEYQNTFVGVYMSRKIIFSKTEHLLNGLMHINTDIIKLIYEQRTYIKHIKLYIFESPKQQKEKIGKILALYNDRFIGKCFEHKLLAENLNIEIQNLMLSELFSGKKMERQFDLENRFKPLEWNDD